MKVSGVLVAVIDAETPMQELIRTAGALYKRLGLKSVSMDDIARELGVSKKTLYQLVPNKEELVQLVMEQDKLRDYAMLKQYREESQDAIDEFLRNSRYHIRQMRNISPSMMYDLKKYYPSIWRKQLQGHHAQFKQGIIDNIERGITEGLYRDDLVADITATLYVATVFTVVDTATFPANERTIHEIIYHHSQYHLNGIVNRAGRERMEAYLQQEGLVSE